MAVYEKATLSKRSGRKNWYVYCTVPIPLRDMMGGAKQIHISTGTSDLEFARDKLRDLEAQLWARLDEAQLTNHPLSKAYLQLEAQISKYTPAQMPKDLNDVCKKLFDEQTRYQIEDDIRVRAGGIIETQATDWEDAPLIAERADLVRDALEIFLLEFRKLNKERFAPVKQTKTFDAVAEEYLQHSSFLRNQKTGEPKRNKTLKDQRNKIETFQKWAGRVRLSEFNLPFAYSYMDALHEIIDAEDKEVGVGVETIKQYFVPLKGVLKFAYQQGYSSGVLWEGLEFTGRGAPTKSYRDFREHEYAKLWSMQIPEQDRLCLAMLAATGCRLEEIAAARWSDIHEETVDGLAVHWLDTRNMVVKNAPSRRLVPLHPEIVRLMPKRGFSWNKHDEDRLFSYPVSGDDNKVSNKASNKLMGYVRAVRDDPTDRTLALHSFRHTFTTICRNAEPTIDWEMRERLLGHGGSETARTYGQAARVANVLKEIRRLDFSFLRKSQ
jgi:integrase